MSESREPQNPSPPDDPRQIPKWTRIYAQNRSLPVVVSLLIFLILAGAIGLPSYLAGYAYRSGNIPLLAACMGVLAVAVTALFYMAIPSWGGRRMDELAQRLYAKEGAVTIGGPSTPRRKALGVVWAVGYGACILASVILGMLGYIPHEYMQPVSALYVVPFMVALGLMLKPAGWPMMLLWPALYALHAILIVSGVPILFAGPWDTLNMLLPIAGYGLLAGLASHLYRRFALRKLRRLARVDLPGTDHHPEESR